LDSKDFIRYYFNAGNQIISYNCHIFTTFNHINVFYYAWWMSGTHNNRIPKISFLIRLYLFIFLLLFITIVIMIIIIAIVIIHLNLQKLRPFIFPNSEFSYKFIILYIRLRRLFIYLFFFCLIFNFVDL